MHHSDCNKALENPSLCLADGKFRGLRDEKFKVEVKQLLRQD